MPSPALQYVYVIRVYVYSIIYIHIYIYTHIHIYADVDVVIDVAVAVVAVVDKTLQVHWRCLRLLGFPNHGETFTGPAPPIWAFRASWAGPLTRRKLCPSP